MKVALTPVEGDISVKSTALKGNYTKLSAFFPSAKVENSVCDRDYLDEAFCTFIKQLDGAIDATNSEETYDFAVSLIKVTTEHKDVKGISAVALTNAKEVKVDFETDGLKVRDPANKYTNISFLLSKATQLTLKVEEDADFGMDNAVTQAVEAKIAEAKTNAPTLNATLTTLLEEFPKHDFTEFCPNIATAIADAKTKIKSAIVEQTTKELQKTIEATTTSIKDVVDLATLKTAVEKVATGITFSGINIGAYPDCVASLEASFVKAIASLNDIIGKLAIVAAGDYPKARDYMISFWDIEYIIRQCKEFNPNAWDEVRKSAEFLTAVHTTIRDGNLKVVFTLTGDSVTANIAALKKAIKDVTTLVSADDVKKFAVEAFTLINDSLPDNETTDLVSYLCFIYLFHNLVLY